MFVATVYNWVHKDVIDMHALTPEKMAMIKNACKPAWRGAFDSAMMGNHRNVGMDLFPLLDAGKVLSI